MPSRFVFLSLSLAVCGCASTQLNYNTNDVSSHFEIVYYNQALNNLSAFIDDENAIPSQMDVSGGTVQTVNAITPSVTFPFTSMVANAATGPAITHTNTVSGSGATLGATNTSQQNYNIVPVIDGNALRNLQALYRHVVHGTPLAGAYQPPRVYFDNRFYLDPYQIVRPQCVLCERPTYRGELLESPRLSVNERLKPGWLIWSTGPGTYSRPLRPGESLHGLGRFGSHELYATERDFRSGVVANFVFFIMPNQQPAEAFTAVGSLVPPARDGGRTPAPDAHASPASPPAPAPHASAQGQKGESDRGGTAVTGGGRPAVDYVVPYNSPLYRQIVPGTNDHVSGPGRDLRSSVLPGIQP